LVKEASTRIDRVPAKYRTETETIETSPATTKWVKKKADRNCLSANPDDCLVWCLVEVPATFRTVTKQVRVGCDSGYTDNGDDCTKTVEIPAEYTTRTYKKLVSGASSNSEDVPAEYTTRTVRKLVKPATVETQEIPAEYTTRTYQKLVKAASTRTEDVPAEYSTRTYKKLVKAASSETIEIPAEYTTRTFKKLVKPATTRTEEIPAEYTTRSMKKLVSAASTRNIEIPAEYNTVSRRNLVRKGGFSEWREVVCNSDVTSELVRKVQSALKSMGYDAGPVDNVMGSLTKAALTKFQKDKGLPVGQLDFETLKALGIDY